MPLQCSLVLVSWERAGSLLQLEQAGLLCDITGEYARRRLHRMAFAGAVRRSDFTVWLLPALYDDCELARDSQTGFDSVEPSGCRSSTRFDAPFGNFPLVPKLCLGTHWVRSSASRQADSTLDGKQGFPTSVPKRSLRTAGTVAYAFGSDNGNISDDDALPPGTTACASDYRPSPRCTPRGRRISPRSSACRVVPSASHRHQRLRRLAVQVRLFLTISRGSGASPEAGSRPVTSRRRRRSAFEDQGDEGFAGLQARTCTGSTSR